MLYSPLLKDIEPSFLLRPLYFCLTPTQAIRVTKKEKKNAYNSPIKNYARTRDIRMEFLLRISVE